MSAVAPIWQSAGYRLVERTGDGHRITDDFLRAYLLRPELVPIEESCAYEQKLHAALIDNPQMPVTPVNLLQIKDPDARENFEIFMQFRDHLTKAGTIEQAYWRLFDGNNLTLPSLFIDQLVHLITAGIFLHEQDPYIVRASECLFRSQKLTNRQGAMMLADQETIEQSAQTGGLGNLGRLLVEASAPLREMELDVLNDDNKAHYFTRSGRFDMVLDVSFGRPGLDAIARVMERWINRFLPLNARIQPVQMIRDERWTWHIGLDATATGILNDLYNGHDVSDARLENLISLFRLDVDQPSLILERVRGRPIYLGLAANSDGTVQLKPQNLLVNLPMAPSN